MTGSLLNIILQMRTSRSLSKNLVTLRGHPHAIRVITMLIFIYKYNLTFIVSLNTTSTNNDGDVYKEIANLKDAFFIIEERVFFFLYCLAFKIITEGKLQA